MTGHDHTAIRPLRRIGVIIHPGRAGARPLAKELGGWAQERGIRLRTLQAERDCLGVDAEVSDEPQLAAGCDLVVALGGDGTLLRAAGLALAHDVPVLGVNLGRLGFLTEVEPDDLTVALEQVRTGHYRIDRRLTLEVTVTDSRPEPHGGPAVPLTAHAINDLVLEKTARQRMVGVAVSIDGAPFSRYAADGIIVATATGSTAYSFSAGGPIVVPHLDAIMLTPIAPHMVFNRSLLLHPDQTLTCEVLQISNGARVEVDGQPLPQVAPGATVRVRRGAHAALLIRLDGTDFFGRVHSKFQLADAEVASAPLGLRERGT